MKKWHVSYVLTDDGMVDESGEVKGAYFTKKEIEDDFVPGDAGGVFVSDIHIEELD